jgi:molybdopterin-guanine dinucleotide biosynthesis protein
MARVIGLIGESGSGKTTAMRNLDPASTFYIDCDKKGLSWKGWREQYNKDRDNYRALDDQSLVLQIFRFINTKEKYKHIKVIVVDTLNGIMVADEMRRMKEKGYDKWQDLAIAVYDIIDTALTMRDDLTIIFVAHSQTERDDSGYMFTRMKTSGKKLDKIVLESKMTTVLYAESKDGEYVLHTRSDKSTAKTPMGAFEQDEIPNDMAEVLKVLEEY